MNVHVSICHESDVAVARLRAREVAREEGLSEAAIAALATAVTEIARNIVIHAERGEVLIEGALEDGVHRVSVLARDEGPGIADLKAAMTDDYSTGHGLGLGLSSARRLMDEFELVSAVGEGTTVRMKKWAR